jgi:hypothetical protein
MSVSVVCIGPNLPDQSKGSFHVHAAGCADVTRSPDYRSREFASDKTNSITIETLTDLVEYVYADQLAEDEESSASDYASDFYLFPCVRGIS